MISISKNTLFYPIAVAHAKKSIPTEEFFPDFTAYLKSQSGDSENDPAKLDFLKEQETLYHALENRQVENIPQYLIDPHHLVGQTVEHFPSDNKFILENLGNQIPNVAVDEIKLVEGNNKLVIEGFQNGEVVLTHTIQGLNLVAEVKDSELVILLDKSGSIFAMDMGHLSESVFKSIIPVYKIYENNEKAPVKFDTSKKHELTFMTRGLKPFTPEQLDKSEDKLIPRDGKGAPLIEAGDLVVMEKVDGVKKLKAILNRKTIMSILLKGTIELSMSTSLASHEGHGRTLTDKINNLLNVNNEGNQLAPIEELLLLIEQEQIKDLPFDQDHIPPEMKTLLKAALQSFDRKQIKSSINKAKQLKKSIKSPTDKFSVEQWYSSYKTIVEQSDFETEELIERLKTLKGVQRQDMVARLLSLGDERANQDFRNNYLALLGANYQKKVYSRPPPKIPLYKRIPYKNISVFAAKISATGMGIWAAYEGISLLDNSISVQMNIYINAISEKLVFHHLGTHPGYVKPLMHGILNMLMILPMVYFYGQFSVYIMHKVSQVLRQHSRGEKYIHRINKALSYKMGKAAQHYKDLSFDRRFVTMSTRPYNAMILPLYNRIFSILNQPTISMISKGINPLMKVTPGSNLGNAISMHKKDKPFRIGFNSPFLHGTKLKQRKILQNNATFHLLKEHKAATDISFNLAVLVTAHENNIDPVTLAQLMKGSLKFDMIKKVESDPEVKAQRKYLADTIKYDLMKIIKNPQETMININPMKLALYSKSAVKYAEKINSNQHLQQTMNKLRNSFMSNTQNFSKFLADFGMADYQKLSTMTADKFAGKQTWKEFSLDLLIVSTIIPIAGERADLDRPSHEWAHGAEYFLNTTPQHGYDVGDCATTHLLVAGPKRMLVYQALKSKTELNYLPLEKILLSTNQRTEGSWTGMKNWAADVFNPMKSNLGAYYPKEFMNKLTTIQAHFFIMVFFRIVAGQQSLDVVFWAWLLHFVGSMIYYAWPWTIINRGNQMEEERIIKEVAKLNEVHVRISQAFLRKDDEALKNAYLDLSNYYQKDESLIQAKIKHVLKMGKKSITSFPKLKKQMTQAMLNTNKTPLLLGELVLLNEAIEKKDFPLAKIITKRLEYILDNDLSDEEIALKLKSPGMKDRIEKVTNMSLKYSPIPTQPNKVVSILSTFFIGALGTTILSVPLALDTFNPNLLNIDFISKIFSIHMAFLASVYILMSEKGASFITRNIIIPFRSLKAVVPQALSTPTCQALVDTIIHF